MNNNDLSEQQDVGNAETSAPPEPNTFPSSHMGMPSGASQQNTPPQPVKDPIAAKFSSATPNNPPVKTNKLTIWALILSIAALVTGLIFPLSAILAIVGLILGIMSLVKKLPGKGVSIAAVSMAAFALLMVPVWAAMVLVAMEGVQEAVQKQESGTSTVTDGGKSGGKTDGASVADVDGTPVTLTNGKVDSTCWSFSVPAGASSHILDDRSSYCKAVLVIDQGNGRGDSLGAISVQAQTGEISLQKIRDTYSGQDQVLSLDEIKKDGRDVVKVVFNDSFNLRNTAYIIIDNSKKFTYKGKDVTSFMVSGTTYNSQFQKNIDDTFDSLVLK